MKVLKKVFTAIGHFFRNIWRYIMTNAWVQPILIVALIFAIIFGLTALPGMFDKIGSWFDDTQDSKIKSKYAKTIDIDEFYELYDGNESFVIVIGEDDCANCKTLYSTINTYMDDESHREIVDTKIYFLNITELLEAVQDDIDEYGEVAFEEKADNFSKLERLGNILFEGYDKIIADEFGKDPYSELQTYGYNEAYGIVAPTTVFFTADEAKDAKHSQMFNILVGQWDFSKKTTTAGYFGINYSFEHWHLSQQEGKWEEAVTARNGLNVNHVG